MVMLVRISIITSLNRSRLSRSTVQVETFSTQTDFVVADFTPPRDSQRVCSDKSKATCANLSSVCGLSVDKSRKAMHIVCKDYYDDEVYLSKKEAMEAVEKSSNGEPPSKNSRVINCQRTLKASYITILHLNEMHWKMSHRVTEYK